MPVYDHPPNDATDPQPLTSGNFLGARRAVIRWSPVKDLDPHTRLPSEELARRSRHMLLLQLVVLAVFLRVLIASLT